MKCGLILAGLVAAASSTAIASPNNDVRHFEPKPKPHHHWEPPRRKVYFPHYSVNDTDGLATEFLKLAHRANYGGTLVIPKGKKVIIDHKLDLTFLHDFQLNLDGELKFTNNVTYWQNPANFFYHPFQKSITFWKWGGKKVKIYGSGTLNGNGQAWYDGFAGREILDVNNTYYRPILFYAENATDLTLDGITMLNSPCWTNFIVTSKKILYNNVFINAFSTNANLPKNTDGWDTYNVDGITVTNSRVDIGDDCFSPKPNTTNIHVENLWCNNTHGVSMGSIGQYPGTKDIIANVHVKNVTLLNGQNAIRLKAWAGPGVGYGEIANVTYEDIKIHNTDYPLVIDQCYFNINSTTCAAYPSHVNITNIKFKNISGISSGKRGRKVVELVCSPGAVCDKLWLENIDLHSPKGEPPVYVCDNIVGNIGVPCVPSNSTTAINAS